MNKLKTVVATGKKRAQNLFHLQAAHQNRKRMQTMENTLKTESITAAARNNNINSYASWLFAFQNAMHVNPNGVDLHGDAANRIR